MANLEINIKNEVLKRLNISLDEYFALLMIHNNCNYEAGIEGLIDKGFITRYGPKNRSGFFETLEGNNTLAYVQSASSIKETQLNKSLLIATKLKGIYPKGKKDGTNYYWADGVSLIAKRLVIFFKKYGDDFTEEQILDATKRYVQSFNGNYEYMKLLKYFIFKEGVGAAGDVESTSDLLTFIENKDEGGVTYRNDYAELR